MELLTAKKERKMLEASIEALHQESLTWLSTIYFWEDENKFYKDILNNRLFQHVTEEDKNTVNSLLDKVVGDKLNLFKNEVRLHEKNLNILFQTKSDAGDYRQKHKHLSQNFFEFEENMKEIKKGVFELFKLVNENFFNGNETLHTIYERRAVRKFKKDVINHEHIEKIISAGRMSPSAMNKQPWKFYVQTHKDKIQLYSKEIMDVSKNILHLSLKKKIEKESDPIFHGAPVVIFITAPKDNEWASIDVGMCAQNLMLAAKSLGYDSCPIGLAKAIDKTKIYKTLNIPNSEEILLAIVLGYGDEKPELHKRNNDNLIFLN